MLAGRELRAVHVDLAHDRSRLGVLTLGELEPSARRHGLSGLRLDASLSPEALHCRHGYERLEGGEP